MVALVSFVLLGIAVVRVAISLARFHAVQQGIPLVQVGQSATSVIASFGRPNYREGTCSMEYSPPSNCAREYVYAHPLTPMKNEYYVVWFS